MNELKVKGAWNEPTGKIKQKIAGVTKDDFFVIMAGVLFVL